jgi:hypothetical protein
MGIGVDFITRKEQGMNRTLLFLSVCVICGCSGPPGDNGPHVRIEEDVPEFVLAIVPDVRSTFDDTLWGKTGQAYDFLMKSKDAFFSDQSDGRLIIGRVSRSRDAVLWEGSHRSFKRTFPSSDALRDALRSGNKGEAHVDESVADIVDNLTEQHERYPKLKSALMICSDLHDPSGSSESEARLTESLRRYKNAGRTWLSLYWVAGEEVPRLKRILAGSGWSSRFQTMKESDLNAPEFQ